MHVTRARVSLKTNDVNFVVTQFRRPPRPIWGVFAASPSVLLYRTCICIRTKTRYTITQFEIRV